MIERVKSAMVGAGAGWVLWLMLALSVSSLAIMLERAWLLGTVIGIVGAFEELGKANAPLPGGVAAGAAAATASQLAPQAVMTNIAEALVATAVGLLVAIPAVAAFNMFQRVVKTTLANTDALSHV